MCLCTQSVAVCHPFDLERVQKFKKLKKSKRSTSNLFLIWRTSCKATLKCMQFFRSYCVDKAVWTWASLKIQKGHRKVNVKLIWDFGIENVPVKLQHGTCNSWGIIKFTSRLDLWQDWKFQKVIKVIKFGRNFHVNISPRKVATWCRQVQRRYYSHKVLSFDHDLVQKVRKVVQRSTSNSTDYDRKISPVKLHDAYNSWAVMASTRLWCGEQQNATCNLKRVIVFPRYQMPACPGNDNTPTAY